MVIGPAALAAAGGRWLLGAAPQDRPLSGGSTNWTDVGLADGIDGRSIPRVGPFSLQELRNDRELGSNFERGERDPPQDVVLRLDSERTLRTSRILAPHLVRRAESAGFVR